MNQNIFKKIISEKNFYDYFAIFSIIILACFPLFMRFHYKINIFLSWEGAYRLYLGQIPYKDFGLPMGFGYWLIPGLFFKIFGPYFMSLIKAQVLINIISGYAFYSILGSFQVPKSIRALSVLIYALSYSFNNFWPWYNHTVIVYQFIGFAFLISEIKDSKSNFFNYKSILSSFFLFLSFFTKQDAGLLGILIAFGLLIYTLINRKDYILLISITFWIIFFGLFFFLPFRQYNIGYWFNYGQAPHNTRISIYDLLDYFLKGSSFIKFYIFFIFLILINKIINIKEFKPDRNSNDFWFGLFTLFIISILFEASIFQVSSYVPADNNIFFHSFALAYLLTNIPSPLLNPTKSIFALSCFFIILWWSSVFWQYMGVVQNWARKTENTSKTDTLITINTYVIHPVDTSFIPQWQWKESAFLSFRRVLMPLPTINGIQRIKELPVVKIKGFKLLNMTELTPLEFELKANLERGTHIPMWYHRGVGMFGLQTQEYIEKIKNNYYDLVLFENIPYLNNFYPFIIRDNLQKYYKKIDQFTAPRNPTNEAFVEVYIRKK